MVLGQHTDVQIRTGHIQSIREGNPCAHELASYLAGLSARCRNLPGFRRRKPGRQVAKGAIHALIPPFAFDQEDRSPAVGFSCPERYGEFHPELKTLTAHFDRRSQTPPSSSLRRRSRRAYWPRAVTRRSPSDFRPKRRRSREANRNRLVDDVVDPVAASLSSETYASPISSRSTSARRRGPREGRRGHRRIRDSWPSPRRGGASAYRVPSDGGTPPRGRTGRSWTG